MPVAADRALARPRRRPLTALAAVLVLVAVGFLALAAIRPPSLEQVGGFSATLAYRQVEAVAAETHVAGSAANDRVREHLLSTLRDLGLTPEVQDTVSVQGGELSSSAGGTGLARVRNVVTLIPGSAPTGRIFLVAHYDSVQTGPGGNDDAAGVATLLETARVLSTGGQRLRNDVVLLFTDAEEACLCGAKAFVDQHPLARGGGVVLNVEARGSRGPAIMFETSRRNSGLVKVYGTTPRPVGTSFAVEVYRLLPNDTDFSPFRDAGFAGLNSAYIDGAAVYHSPADRPAAMDRRSLQHHGANTLALTRSLGAMSLPALTTDHDATYFPAPWGQVAYSGRLVWPLAAAAVLAVLALAWLVRRRGLAGGGRLAAGFGLALVPLVAAPAVAQLFWWVLTLIRPAYLQLLIDPYRPGWYRASVVAFSAGVLFAWYALLRRRLTPVALAVGGLGWLAVFGVLLAAYAPGGSYLAALPALAGALAAIVALHRRLAPVALVAGAAVAVLVLVPTLVMFFPALGLKLAGAGAVFATLLGLALLPIVDLLHPEAGGQRGLVALRARRLGALPAAAALVAALAFAAIGLRVDVFDAAHPAPTQLMYALDADTGQARWLSDETTPAPWTAQYVRGPATSVADDLPAFGPEKVLTGPAPAATLPAPQLTTLSDSRSGDTRTLRLRLLPQRPVRLATLHVGGAEVLAATVAGRPLPADRTTGTPWSFGFVFHAPPPQGVDLTLTVRTTGPLKLRVMDAADGLTGLPGFRPRPPEVGIVGSHTSEMVAVARTFTR